MEGDGDDFGAQKMVSLLLENDFMGYGLISQGFLAFYV